MKVPGRFCWLVLAMGAIAVSAVPAWASKPSPPRSAKQALRDGCQRSNFGIGFNQTPEWVYVYRNPKIRKAVGVSRVSHSAVDDAILQHNWYDFNANLVPDRQYRYLLGGNPKLRTGNFSGDDEETDRLHYEWESHTLPRFVWPTDGDRTTTWGSWIWDCGHWKSTLNNQGGKVTGEHTEFHPLNAIVVDRRRPYLRSHDASQTDVFVSNQGTKAHAVEKCALIHHPISGTSYPQYDAGFRPCAMAPANRVQPMKNRYRFFVPAPARPAGASRLKYRLIARDKDRSVGQRIRVKPDGLAVTLSLKSGTQRVRYGKSFVVWWAGSGTGGPTPLKVNLKSLLINKSDPDPIYGAQTSPWNLYLDVNGKWKLLNRWIPELTAVHDGQRIPINRTIKVGIPRGDGLWVQAGGRECDEPGGTSLLGVYANLVHPCPANTTEQNPNVFNLLMNDYTGTILDTYGSPRAALGTHTSTSAATVRFPGSGPINLGHGNQGDKAYELTYAVRRG